MEQRKKTLSILLTLPRKKVLLELFDALDWPNVYGACEGLFRVRIARKWHCPAGKHSFLTASAVGALLEKLLLDIDFCAADCAKTQPEIKTGTRVSVPLEYRGGLPWRTELGYTMAPPHLGADGRWQVWCRCASGAYLAPLEDIKPVTLGAKK